MVIRRCACRGGRSSVGQVLETLPEAARIALKTAIDYLKEHPEIELVRFVLFGNPTYDVFAEEMKNLT